MVQNTRAPLRTDRLRPLNRPRPATVELNGDGLPRAVREGNRVRSVEEVCETWRVDDEWWRATISRRYIEVVLEGGRHVVLYQDLMSGGWFVQRSA